jgi:hypothetical protein
MFASRCLATPTAYCSSSTAYRLATCAAVAAAGAALALPRPVATAAASGGRRDGAGRVGGRARKKGELPTKVCATCGLEFEYRQKWKAVWDDVKYCSERCRRGREQGRANSGDAGGGAAAP